eukprot:GHVQ01012688.1.p1 GENE.GHVQ01012688.1~~GHVQ01012688.1.p1  ORF type:complete len:2749 (-),score=325.29 GHVQ01012688.1:1370-9616(-)
MGLLKELDAVSGKFTSKIPSDRTAAMTSLAEFITRCCSTQRQNHFRHCSSCMCSRQEIDPLTEALSMKGLAASADGAAVSSVDEVLSSFSVCSSPTIETHQLPALVDFLISKLKNDFACTEKAAQMLSLLLRSFTRSMVSLQLPSATTPSSTSLYDSCAITERFNLETDVSTTPPEPSAVPQPVLSLAGRHPNGSVSNNFLNRCPDRDEASVTGNSSPQHFRRSLPPCLCLSVCNTILEDVHTASYSQNVRQSIYRLLLDCLWLLDKFKTYQWPSMPFASGVVGSSNGAVEELLWTNSTCFIPQIPNPPTDGSVDLDVARLPLLEPQQVTLLCRQVEEEKDPRNLLLTFPLLEWAGSSLQILHWRELYGEVLLVTEQDLCNLPTLESPCGEALVTNHRTTCYSAGGTSTVTLEPSRREHGKMEQHKTSESTNLSGFDKLGKLFPDGKEVTLKSASAKLGETLMSYFPIQFQPPPNDQFGVTESQLKKGFLKALQSSATIGNTVLDSLLEALTEHCLASSDLTTGSQYDSDTDSDEEEDDAMGYTRKEMKEHDTDEQAWDKQGKENQDRQPDKGTDLWELSDGTTAEEGGERKGGYRWWKREASSWSSEEDEESGDEGADFHYYQYGGTNDRGKTRDSAAVKKSRKKERRKRNREKEAMIRRGEIVASAGRDTFEIASCVLEVFEVWQSVGRVYGSKCVGDRVASVGECVGALMNILWDSSKTTEIMNCGYNGRRAYVDKLLAAGSVAIGSKSDDWRQPARTNKHKPAGAGSAIARKSDGTQLHDKDWITLEASEADCREDQCTERQLKLCEQVLCELQVIGNRYGMEEAGSSRTVVQDWASIKGVFGCALLWEEAVKVACDNRRVDKECCSNAECVQSVVAIGRQCLTSLSECVRKAEASSRSSKQRNKSKHRALVSPQVEIRRVFTLESLCCREMLVGCMTAGVWRQLWSDMYTELLEKAEQLIITEHEDRDAGFLESRQIQEDNSQPTATEIVCHSKKKDDRGHTVCFKQKSATLKTDNELSPMALCGSYVLLFTVRQALEKRCHDSLLFVGHSCNHPAATAEPVDDESFGLEELTSESGDMSCVDLCRGLLLSERLLNSKRRRASGDELAHGDAAFEKEDDSDLWTVSVDVAEELLLCSFLFLKYGVHYHLRVADPQTKSNSCCQLKDSSATSRTCRVQCVCARAVDLCSSGSSTDSSPRRTSTSKNRSCQYDRKKRHHRSCAYRELLLGIVQRIYGGFLDVVMGDRQEDESYWSGGGSLSIVGSAAQRRVDAAFAGPRERDNCDAADTDKPADLGNWGVEWREDVVRHISQYVNRGGRVQGDCLLKGYDTNTVSHVQRLIHSVQSTLQRNDDGQVASSWFVLRRAALQWTDGSSHLHGLQQDCSNSSGLLMRSVGIYVTTLHCVEELTRQFPQFACTILYGRITDWLGDPACLTRRLPETTARCRQTVHPGAAALSHGVQSATGSSIESEHPKRSSNTADWYSTAKKVRASLSLSGSLSFAVVLTDHSVSVEHHAVPIRETHHNGLMNELDESGHVTDTQLDGARASPSAAAAVPVVLAPEGIHQVVGERLLNTCFDLFACSMSQLHLLNSSYLTKNSPFCSLYYPELRVFNAVPTEDQSAIVRPSWSSVGFCETWTAETGDIVALCESSLSCVIYLLRRLLTSSAQTRANSLVSNGTGGEGSSSCWSSSLLCAVLRNCCDSTLLFKWLAISMLSLPVDLTLHTKITDVNLNGQIPRRVLHGNEIHGITTVEDQSVGPSSAGLPSTATFGACTTASYTPAASARSLVHQSMNNSSLSSRCATTPGPSYCDVSLVSQLSELLRLVSIYSCFSANAWSHSRPRDQLCDTVCPSTDKAGFSCYPASLFVTLSDFLYRYLQPTFVNAQLSGISMANSSSSCSYYSQLDNAPHITGPEYPCPSSITPDSPPTTVGLSGRLLRVPPPIGNASFYQLYSHRLSLYLYYVNSCIGIIHDYCEFIPTHVVLRVLSPHRQPEGSAGALAGAACDENVSDECYGSRFNRLREICVRNLLTARSIPPGTKSTPPAFPVSTRIHLSEEPSVTSDNLAIVCLYTSSWFNAHTQAVANLSVQTLSLMLALNCKIQYAVSAKVPHTSPALSQIAGAETATVQVPRCRELNAQIIHSILPLRTQTHLSPAACLGNPTEVSAQSPAFPSAAQKHVQLVPWRQSQDKVGEVSDVDVLLQIEAAGAVLYHLSLISVHSFQCVVSTAILPDILQSRHVARPTASSLSPLDARTPPPAPSPENSDYHKWLVVPLTLSAAFPVELSKSRQTGDSSVVSIEGLKNISDGMDMLEKWLQGSKTPPSFPDVTALTDGSAVLTMSGLAAVLHRFSSSMFVRYDAHVCAGCVLCRRSTASAKVRNSFLLCTTADLSRRLAEETAATRLPSNTASRTDGGDTTDMNNGDQAEDVLPPWVDVGWASRWGYRRNGGLRESELNCLLSLLYALPIEESLLFLPHLLKTAVAFGLTSPQCTRRPTTPSTATVSGTVAPWGCQSSTPLHAQDSFSPVSCRSNASGSGSRRNLAVTLEDAMATSVSVKTLCLLLRCLGCLQDVVKSLPVSVITATATDDGSSRTQGDVAALLPSGRSCYCCARTSSAIRDPRNPSWGNCKDLPAVPSLNSQSLQTTDVSTSRHILQRLLYANLGFIHLHMESIVSLLLPLVNFRRCGLVRRLALDILYQYSQEPIPYSSIQPLKGKVLQKVRLAVNDHRREVRLAAGVCRMAWLCCERM